MNVHHLWHGRKHDKFQVVVYQLLYAWIKCIMLCKHAHVHFYIPKIKVFQRGTFHGFWLFWVTCSKTKGVCLKTTLIANPLALQIWKRKTLVWYIPKTNGLGMMMQSILTLHFGNPPPLVGLHVKLKKKTIYYIGK